MHVVIIRCVCICSITLGCRTSSCERMYIVVTLGQFDQANFQSAAVEKLFVKLSSKNSEIKFEYCKIYAHYWKLTFKV